MRDRRKIEAYQADCVIALANEHGFGKLAQKAVDLLAIRYRYNKVPIAVDRRQHRLDRETFRNCMVEAGTEVYHWLTDPERRHTSPLPAQPAQAVVYCQCADKGERFADERAEVERLPEAEQIAERLLCLLYIGFILTMVARLHSLLISVALMFSMAALGVAVYPFVPVIPLVTAGLVLLAIIALSFFKVFSGLDTDPIMARIVNGDDRKLQWSFYGKFAESMALPLLTLAGTLLPGGASRLLDLTRVLFSHGQ